VEDGLTLCDLTQSYSASGGGIRTYLTAKRAYLDTCTQHRHLLIVPGAKNRTIAEGRHVTVEIASPRVPGSPNYRLLLRSRAVIKVLQKYSPETIECLDAYNLPWAAIAYRREAQNVKLIAGYRTDFPTVYVEAGLRKFIGSWAAAKLKTLSYRYAGKLYRQFDSVYALDSEMAAWLGNFGVGGVAVLPLGVDIDIFHPNQRDETWRSEIGVGKTDPILVYAGRLDREKQADMVVAAFLKLPKEMNASLVMLGDGKLKSELIKKTTGKSVHFPGFVSDRVQLAKILASGDIYVSAMAFETFGISIIEAQSCGLPVVGVSAGAMPARVPAALGALGPVSDVDAMVKNIEELWTTGQVRSIGKHARRHVEENFSWDKAFEYLLNHIYPNLKSIR